MTVYQIDTLTLHWCAEEDSEAARRELLPLTLPAYNEGAAQLCRDYIRPWAWEKVLPLNRTLELSSFSRPCVHLQKISAAPDYLLPGGEEATGIDWDWMGTEKVYLHSELPEVYARYVYAPLPLVWSDPLTPAPTPDLPEEAHPLLSYFAAWRVLSGKRKLQRAEYFHALFLAGASRLRTLPHAGFIHKY